MSTKKTARISTKKLTDKVKQSQRVLDENTSAIVIAEYLNIADVKPDELDVLTEEVPRGKPSRGLNYREIALSFRVSEVLGVPDAFKIHPSFMRAFGRARAVIAALKPRTEERAA